MIFRGSQTELQWSYKNIHIAICKGISSLNNSDTDHHALSEILHLIKVSPRRPVPRVPGINVQWQLSHGALISCAGRGAWNATWVYVRSSLSTSWVCGSVGIWVTTQAMPGHWVKWYGGFAWEYQQEDNRKRRKQRPHEIWTFSHGTIYETQEREFLPG